MQSGYRPDGDYDPFGFHDGVAQPSIARISGDGVPTDEFILGYPNHDACGRGEETRSCHDILQEGDATLRRRPSSHQHCSQRRHLPAASYEYSTVVPVVSFVAAMRRPAWSYK
jgi:hypothetical protein